MASVVQFGAGAIGRGFLGQLWCEAGYDVVFVDINKALVEALNQTGSYPLRLVDNDFTEERVIGPVRALHTDNIKAVADAIAQCAFTATAVGIENLPAVGPLLAQGLRRRGKAQPPLPVFVCENGVCPDLPLALATLNALPFTAATVNRYDNERVRFLPTIVDRMVPPVKPDELGVTTEPHGILSYQEDRRLWGVFQPPTNLIPLSFHDYGYWGQWAKKLYLHNGGHFVIASLGLEQGHSTIAEALADFRVRGALDAFWAEASAGLSAEYGLVQLDGYTASLLARFQNRVLADTCARVARNAQSKLAPNERLRGPRALCEKHGLPTAAIDQAIKTAGSLACEG